MAYGYNKSFLDASDDIYFDVQQTVTEGDKVVILTNTSATMHHALVTPQQTFPATGKGGSGDKTPVVILVEIKDGKIVREKTVWNQLEVFMMWGLLG
jgi:hypothetical protein